MNNQYRIAVIDQWPLYIIGVERIILRGGRAVLVASGESSIDFQQIIEEHEPDAILVDTTVPGYLAAVRFVTAAHPKVRVICVAPIADWQHAAEVLRAGAAGYILRRTTGLGLTNAIVAVCNGEKHIPPALVCHLAQNFPKSLPQGRMSCALRINMRERMIIDSASKGLSNPEIAHSLNMGISTVKLCKTAIFRKLGVRNILEAIAEMPPLDPRAIDHHQ